MLKTGTVIITCTFVAQGWSRVHRFDVECATALGQQPLLPLDNTPHSVLLTICQAGDGAYVQIHVPACKFAFAQCCMCMWQLNLRYTILVRTGRAHATGLARTAALELELGRQGTGRFAWVRSCHKEARLAR